MEFSVEPAPASRGSADRTAHYVAALEKLEVGKSLVARDISWLEVKFLRNHYQKVQGKFSVRTKRLPSAGPIERYDAWVIRVE